MRVTEKGQVTIPKNVRDAVGIGAGSEVEFVLDGDTIMLRKVHEAPSRGNRLAARLRGRGDVALTTDEIMAMTRSE